jgi:antitoxin component YwqK of YwqJK toxin-antitoxin module
MNKYKLICLLLIFWPFNFIQSKDYDLSDLIFKNGFYHEKKTNKLFNGYVKGIVNVKIVRGKYDGSYKQYFSNGQLRTEGFYVSGVKNGLWKSYHENGTLHSKGMYKHGYWDGLWVDHYEDGSIRSKGYYQNGKLID